MDARKLLSNAFLEHREALELTHAQVSGTFAACTDICQRAVRAGNKLMFFGNGGSASDAQHLAAELTVRFAKDRPAIAALALTADSTALTAAGNDLGFERVFARQIEALARKGDVAIGISTSGNSENVLQAMYVAKHLGCSTIALLGRDGGRLRAVVDVAMIVPADSTARIQEMHILLGHALCNVIEADFSSH